MLLHFRALRIARKKSFAELLPLNPVELTEKSLFANSIIRFYKLDHSGFHTVAECSCQHSKGRRAFAFTVSGEEEDTSWGHGCCIRVYNICELN